MMTRQEVSERFQIPAVILDAYEKWDLCDSARQTMGVRQYDDRDIELLSLMVILREIGFSKEDIFAYMRLYLSGESTLAERRALLDRKRADLLGRIHAKENQLNQLDDLRYEMQKKQREEKENIV